MKLNNRLDVLEQKLAGHVGSRSEAGNLLWDSLVATAERLTDATPDERWLKRKSNKEIAAMAMLEQASGKSTPALWATVKELAGSETPVQKMFAGLEAMHGTD